MATTVETPPEPLSGRRSQAARNDQRILEAARTVFTADPEAPISMVAERAGVGISALYRRYRSKEELLQRLSLDGLRRYIAAAEAALADEGDPWLAFTQFMRRCVDDGAGSLTVRFVGRFTAAEELHTLGRIASEATQRLIERVQAADALRADIVVADLSLILEQLQSIQVADERHASQLRHRYLALALDALHLSSAQPLPGPPPRWEEISGRYTV